MSKNSNGVNKKISLFTTSLLGVFFVLFTLFISLSFLNQVNAEYCNPNDGPCPEGYEVCNPNGGPCPEPEKKTIPDPVKKPNERKIDISLDNPLKGVSGGGAESVALLIGMIIKALMGLIGSIVLLVFVYGSFIWLTSRGNPEKVAEGTKTMLYAAIGTLVVFLSYMLAQRVIDIITGVSG